MPRLILVLTALLFGLPLSAVAVDSAPHALIERTVTQMTSRIEGEREQLESDEEYAREVVDEELGELVDFRRITQLVMGRHFQNATLAQKKAFLAAFRSSLVNTYAAGITLYQGQQITVLPATEDDVRDGRARVRTELRTDTGEVIPVFFSLYRNSGGNWLVENVIVNGLNLGKTYRSQFDQSVAQFAGDLDQVISNWSSDVDVGI